MKVVYYVQRDPHSSSDFEVVRWQNHEGIIKKVSVQLARTRRKAEVAAEIWRRRERVKNGQN